MLLRVSHEPFSTNIILWCLGLTPHPLRSIRIPCCSVRCPSALRSFMPKSCIFALAILLELRKQNKTSSLFKVMCPPKEVKFPHQSLLLSPGVALAADQLPQKLPRFAKLRLFLLSRFRRHIYFWELPTCILDEDTHPVIRAIGVSHTACKDEFHDEILDLTAGLYLYFLQHIFY